jgi:hypothetical protein
MTSGCSSASENNEASGDDSEGPDIQGLKSDDVALIKTSNSLYQFSVTDSALRQGKLCGGALGDSPRSAVLVVSIREGADGQVTEISGLKVGARAVFYLVSPVGMERLITSAITDLTLIRDGKPWPLPISHLDRAPSSLHSAIIPA